ncbi:MAG: hypothetical protein OEM26_09890 [Saprospiraceae bacterium]|nr:hypothetical protein [Saprospiraceae bacterium]
MSNFIEDINEFIKEDKLSNVLAIIISHLESSSDGSQLIIEAQNLSGRLIKLNQDINNAVIDNTQSYKFLNQIRIGVLELVNDLKKKEREGKGTDKAKGIRTSDLQDKIKAVNTELNANAKFDLIFKVFLLFMLLVGIGLLVFTVVTDREINEVIVLGALALAIMLIACFFLFRYKELENRNRRLLQQKIVQ